MAATNKPAPATAADLRARGEDSRCELIAGVIVEKAAPRGEHGDTQGGIISTLRRRFHRGPGGRWPGGWWILAEVHVEYPPEIYCHDAVGWRRDRVAERPSGWPIQLRPDWVCELLSPNHEKRDLVDKLRTLHAAAVPHYWILHPEQKTLVVHRWQEAGYLIALTATSGETVRAEPFEAVDLRVGVLFGDEEDDD